MQCYLLFQEIRKLPAAEAKYIHLIDCKAIKMISSLTTCKNTFNNTN